MPFAIEFFLIFLQCFRESYRLQEGPLALK